MCEQNNTLTCSFHARSNLILVIEGQGRDSSELFLPDDLRKVNRELAAAWKLFLLTEDGLDYLAEKIQIHLAEKDSLGVKTLRAQLKHYKLQRTKILREVALLSGERLTCQNCGEYLERKQTRFCDSNCNQEFKRRHFLKHCKDCGKTPQEVEFPKNRKTIDGLSTVCKPCNSDRSKKAYNGYSDNKRTDIRIRKKSPKSKSSLLLRKFGIDIDVFSVLLEAQNGCCEICSESFTENNPPHVDHDHSTGKVRALLCRTCNMGLGVFHDNPVKLLQAIEYLRYTSDETHRHMVANLITKRPQEIRHDLRGARGILTVSKEGRLRVIEAQNFQCACCKDDLSHMNFRKINIDHDHNELYIRGILCKNCNIGLGMFYEKKTLFESAITYLNKHTDQ